MAWHHSLVAAVPLPGVAWAVGHEVGRALVLHPLGETQKDPHVVVGRLGAVRRAVGERGEDKEMCQHN